MYSIAYSWGALGFKNKKLISTDLFTPMKDTCGFSDAASTTTRASTLKRAEECFDGNNFITIGDSELLIGFYKDTITLWWPKKNKLGRIHSYQYEKINFSAIDLKHRKIWCYFVGDRIKSELVVRYKNGYYVARINYKGNDYKICFGEGVDVGFYKRTHRINYFRSIEYFFKKLF